MFRMEDLPWASLTVFGAIAPCHGRVKLPALISDHMVLIENPG